MEPEERGNKSLEDIADGFPTDLAMAALVESDRLLNKGHNCSVCEDVAATSFCLNCGDMLCSTCKKGHGKLSATRHHTVEDLSSLTPDKIALPPVQSMPTKLASSSVPHTACPSAMFAPGRNTEAARK